jgi:hypothetical protein
LRAPGHRARLLLLRLGLLRRLLGLRILRLRCAVLAGQHGVGHLHRRGALRRLRAAGLGTLGVLDRGVGAEGAADVRRVHRRAGRARLVDAVLARAEARRAAGLRLVRVLRAGVDDQAGAQVVAELVEAVDRGALVVEEVQEALERAAVAAG